MAPSWPALTAEWSGMTLLRCVGYNWPWALRKSATRLFCKALTGSACCSANPAPPTELT